ncbi:MAG: hypothetical protein IJZ29_05350 [Clostridia bacterium]|nr:hypothetical protein [Clostridia bacterium]
MSKTTQVLLIIILVAVIGIGGYFAYDAIFNTANASTQQQEQQEQEETIDVEKYNQLLAELEECENCLEQMRAEATSLNNLANGGTGGVTSFEMAEIDALYTTFNELDAEIDTLNESILVKEADIDDLQSRVTALNDKIDTLNEDLAYNSMELLDTRDKYFKYLNEYNASQISKAYESYIDNNNQVIIQFPVGCSYVINQLNEDGSYENVSANVEDFVDGTAINFNYEVGTYDKSYYFDIYINGIVWESGYFPSGDIAFASGEYFINYRDDIYTISLDIREFTTHTVTASATYGDVEYTDILFDYSNNYGTSSNGNVYLGSYEYASFGVYGFAYSYNIDKGVVISAVEEVRIGDKSIDFVAVYNNFYAVVLFEMPETAGEVEIVFSTESV